MIDDARDWKQIHADEADKALGHPLVEGAIAEFMFNLSNNFGVKKDDALLVYAIGKVAMYAAQVARAQALGFDPNLLKLSDAEASEEQMKLAEIAVRAGKPVVLLDLGVSLIGDPEESS